MRWRIGFSIILCLSVLLPLSAHARPAEKLVRMQRGEEKLIPGLGGQWRVHSYAAQRVQARQLTLILLSHDRSKAVFFWLVKVGAPLPELRRPDTKTLSKRCSCKEGKKVFLTCVAADTGCLDALDAYLLQADLQGPDLSLRFELKAAQVLLGRMQKALKQAGFQAVELGFLGGGLVADGLVKDDAEWLRMMRIIHENMLGRLRLMDRVKRMDRPKSGEKSASDDPFRR